MAGETPPYHYGTHYSSAMIVASYLIRMEPFAQHFLRLQVCPSPVGLLSHIRLFRCFRPYYFVLFCFFVCLSLVRLPVRSLPGSWLPVSLFIWRLFVSLSALLLSSIHLFGRLCLRHVSDHRLASPLPPRAAISICLTGCFIASGTPGCRLASKPTWPTSKSLSRSSFTCRSSFATQTTSTWVSSLSVALHVLLLLLLLLFLRGEARVDQ